METLRNHGFVSHFQTGSVCCQCHKWTTSLEEPCACERDLDNRQYLRIQVRLWENMRVLSARRTHPNKRTLALATAGTTDLSTQKKTRSNNNTTSSSHFFTGCAANMRVSTSSLYSPLTDGMGTRGHAFFSFTLQTACARGKSKPLGRALRLLCLEYPDHLEFCEALRTIAAELKKHSAVILLGLLPTQQTKCMHNHGSRR